MKRTILRCIALFAAAVGLAGEASRPPLTLRDAETRALKAHPKITVAELRALVAKETVAEARSPLFPTLTGNATVVGTDGDNNRVAAGGLNNPIIYDRQALGLNVSWQLFDFGRAVNLLGSAQLRARAEEKAIEATRAQILMGIDVVYFTILQSQALVRVARQTLETRQALRDQIAALAANQIKSQLDVSFAETSLAEARVLLSRAINEEQAGQARLGALLGERLNQEFALLDEPPRSAPFPGVEQMIVSALANRPDLLRLRLERDAASKFARAERALHYPTISAVGVGGVIPEHNPRLSDNYLAAGINLNVPIFSGLRDEARRKAAVLKAKAAEEMLRDEENNVIRDVRMAWLSVNNAIERQSLTAKLVESASGAFSLAEAKYKAGVSSISELAQAQLSKTSAEIAHVGARFEVFIQQAVLDFQIGDKASSVTR